MNNLGDPALGLTNTQQLGFLATLPPDIIPEILSFLDQVDCLTCMAVCRSWFRLIPQYAKGIWTTLRLDERNAGFENQRLSHCLGDHVKNVTLDTLKNEKDGYHLMHNLLGWGCTRIKFLELNGCQTDDQDLLLEVLRKLGPHLTQLKMLSHESNIAFLHILHACPRLTYFTYQSKIDYSHDAGVIDKEPAVLNPVSSIGSFPSITHLNIDAMLDTQVLLNPILKRCPNLRSFTGTSFATADIQDNETFPRYVADYDLLFEWCPKLTYINGSLSYVYLKDISEQSDEDGFTGLRKLRVADAYQQSGIIRRLTESQDTLETLSVNPILAYETAFSWTDILTKLQLTKLQDFDFRRIHFDGSSIVNILNRCPALERLYLESNTVELDPTTVRLLLPMRQLHYLSWFYISFVGGLSLVTLLERFPGLENLVMRYLTLPPTFPDDCECSQHLQELCLRDIQWTLESNKNERNDAPIHLFEWFARHSKICQILLSGIENFSSRTLPAIATISTLTILELELDEAQCGETEAAHLYQFATSLINTAIDDMYIETWWHLPDPAVIKLKELSHIRDLRVYHRWEEHYCPQCSCRHEASSS
ncbi:hypothetical protein BJV82DRAFT_718485 [Fennellomyces sp. T-0311]|nr:hypothetical protein BJV82DRAFT_718485 [Fennellomyces sp. T-0311]